VRRGFALIQNAMRGGLEYLRRPMWSMYGIKGVVSRGWGMCLTGCGVEDVNVQIVWMELVARERCNRLVFGNRGNSLPRASR